LTVAPRALLRDTRAAVAAEFALIVPVFLMLFLGIIDISLWMWTHNRAEKATQAAVRHAAVIDYVPQGLVTTNFAAAYNIPSGDSIPIGTVAPILCGGSQGATCSSFGWDGAAFAAILARARQQFPELTAANLSLRYEHVGLGYAGDPNGSDISPVVTVEIIDNAPGNRLFQPIFLGLFMPNGFNLSGIASSMTMEDGDGTVSYSA
jgi:hypothetical protein